MTIKLICLLFALCVLCGKCSEEEDEGLTDFDFESEQSTDENTALDDVDNDVDYDESKDESGKNSIFSKEEYVRKVMLESMKNPDTKKQVARVLPILRVMTPDQKLALATLITTQVLSPPESKSLSLDEVCKHATSFHKLISYSNYNYHTSHVYNIHSNINKDDFHYCFF